MPKASAEASSHYIPGVKCIVPGTLCPYAFTLYQILTQHLLQRAEIKPFRKPCEAPRISVVTQHPPFAVPPNAPRKCNSSCLLILVSTCSMKLKCRFCTCFALQFTLQPLFKTHEILTTNCSKYLENFCKAQCKFEKFKPSANAIKEGKYDSRYTVGVMPLGSAPSV